jgi:hypothetical protein
MQTGMTLQQLAAQVDTMRQSRRDFRAHDAAIQMTTRFGHAPVQLDVRGAGSFGINPIAHEQLAEKLGIPKRYYDRMLEEAPGLLAGNVNEWLRKGDDTRLVRTLDGNVRAVLSKAYRPFDYDAALEAVLPVLAEAGVTVESCQITERRLYLAVTDPKLQAAIRPGHHVFLKNVGDDLVVPGVVISDSEVGFGRLKVEGFIKRLECYNGLITTNCFGRNHVGRAKAVAGGEVEIAIGDDTKEAEDKALSLRLRDTVKEFLSEANLAKETARLRTAAENRLTGDPVKVIEAVAVEVGLTEPERGAALRHLIEGGDLSGWGVANAVTRLAHDAESYERNIELQRQGNLVVELAQGQWSALAAA